MVSKKQVSANRENAKKSTGPKTKEGKETSAINATKHGLTARRTVICTESQEEFDFFRQQMIEDIKPDGAMQLILAERVIDLAWRLKRVTTIQNEAFDEMISDRRPGTYKRIKKSGYDPNDLVLGDIAINDFSYAGILERILKYEQQIEKTLYKAMKELKKLQNEANLRKSDSTTQYDIRNTQYENMQNEPNSNDQINVTQEITEDYEHALLHGYPPDKPYPPISNPDTPAIKTKNTTKDVIANRNGGRSEAYNNPVRSIMDRINKK